MNGKYCAESKNVEALVDQIRQNTKNELFLHKMSNERKSPHQAEITATFRWFTNQ